MLAYVWTAARLLFGLFFLGTGIAIVKVLTVGGWTPTQSTDAARNFTEALATTRFMDPATALDYLAGGVALLFRRAAPLGLILLFPPVLVIFLFHIMLDSMTLWGTLWALWWTLLAWHYRRGFEPLWAYAG